MMKSKLAIVLAAVSCTVPLAHGAFLPDTISVVRVGDGSLPLTGSVAQNAYVLTYDAQTGSLLNTVPLTGTVLPSKDDGADGHLSFTGNGQYLTLGGYTAAAGSSDPVAAAVPRAVVRLDGSGNVATASLSGVYVGKSVVAVASPDGNSFFIAGENTTAGSGGLRYLPSLASTTTVNVSRTQTGSNADAFRNLRVVNGQLYANTASQGSFTNRGVYAMTIGGGLPVAATDTPSVATSVIVNTEGNLTDSYGNLSPDSTGKLYPKTDSALIDLNNDGTFDLAYSTGGKEDLEKWVRAGSNWIRTETIDAPTLDITGKSNNEINAIDYALTPSGVQLFLSNDFGIWKFTDTGGLGAFASPDITSDPDGNFRRYLTTSYFISAGTNEQFRGLAVFVPEPTTAALLIPAVALLARRRNRCA